MNLMLQILSTCTCWMNGEGNIWHAERKKRNDRSRGRSVATDRITTCELRSSFILLSFMLFRWLRKHCLIKADETTLILSWLKKAFSFLCCSAFVHNLYCEQWYNGPPLLLSSPSSSRFKRKWDIPPAGLGRRGNGAIYFRNNKKRPSLRQFFIGPRRRQEPKT